LPMSAFSDVPNALPCPESLAVGPHLSDLPPPTRIHFDVGLLIASAPLAWQSCKPTARRLGDDVRDEFPREACVVLGNVVSEPFRPAIRAVSELRGPVRALAKPATGQASHLIHPLATLEVLGYAPPVILWPGRVHEQRRDRPLERSPTLTLTNTRALQNACPAKARMRLWQFRPPVADEAGSHHKASLLITICGTQLRRNAVFCRRVRGRHSDVAMCFPAR